jgi:Predicted flavin-nucleotide-binding protein
MDKRVLKFLQRHRISVLTTLLTDGKPHSASMHYAFSEKPFYFVYLTEKESRKLSGLKVGKTLPASLVIGFSEEEWITMQIEGDFKIINERKELELGWKVYAEKYVGMDKYKNSKDSVLVKFIPNWWRYTEVKPYPSVIISSDN